MIEYGVGEQVLRMIEVLFFATMRKTPAYAGLHIELLSCRLGLVIKSPEQDESISLLNESRGTQPKVPKRLRGTDKEHGRTVRP